MADAPVNPTTPDAPHWRELWQVPVLAVGAAALVGAATWAFMTAPKPDATNEFDEARHLVEIGKYGEALDVLNVKIRPEMATDHLTPEQRREFHVLRARSLFLGQREMGINRPENNEAIRGEYETAEKLHEQLTPDDVHYLAQTLLALGDIDGAVTRAQSLPEPMTPQRIELLKQMIEADLAHEPPRYTRAIDLITQLSGEPRLAVNDRLWALTRQAEVLVATGFANDAITKLVRTLPRLDDVPPEAMGSALVTLAKAYMSEHELVEAGKQLDRAQAMVGAEHPLTPEITLLRAEIDHHEGSLTRAREGYVEVLERYAFAEGRLRALLGLAEAQAQIHNTSGTGAPEASIERYTELVDALVAGEHDHEATPQRVSESLLSRFQEQYDRGDFATSLRFAQLAQKLWKDDPPAEVLHAIADGSIHQANVLLSDAATGGVLSLAEADPATQREAKARLLDAGEAFRRHASKVVLTDNVAYGESLWAAADAFDRAGDLELCVATFQQFATEFPADTRRPEAVFRLAQAYRARGDLELAAKLYQELVDLRGVPDGSGPYADLSFVPLAQTLLHDADPANDTRGEELLNRVLSGEITGPDTPIFRDALKELGEHHARQKRYPQAIERLEQYLALAPSEAPDVGTAGVRFRLAECCRLSAAELAETLKTGMPDREQRELELRRAERLRRGLELFEQVKHVLDAQPRRSAVQDLTVRNAYFFAADCAFDLRDFDGSIRLYDAARERYPKDPASLVAMTQVVSALLAKGERAKAAIANQRARRFLESLPEAVWDDPALPMGRADWERWLDAQDDLLSGGPRGRTAGAFEGD